MRQQCRGKFSVFGSFAWLIALILGVLACAANVQAAQERYDYDALGRLIRVIDEQGRVTEYVYDPAGNILQVITGGSAAQAPAVTSTTPTALRRGETKAVVIAGTGFTGSRVNTPDPGLDIVNLRSTTTQISFDLMATASAALGPQAFAISNAAGSTSALITINPVLPKLGMSPLPIALAPATTRSFYVSLSSPDNIPHTINLASSDAAKLTINTPSVTIPAGQTEAVVSITSVAVGTAAINLTSSTLANTAVPVFVTAEFIGLTTSIARALGVDLLAPPVVGGGASIGPVMSNTLGVAFGSYISGVVPGVLSVGSGPTNLVISGRDLGAVTAVIIQPTEGITQGAISIAPDGSSITVPITVAAGAAPTPRRVALLGANAPYIAAPASANQVLIARPPPVIESMSPIVVTASGAVATLNITGRNMQSVQSVSMSPSAGISISNAPTVNAEGTQLSVLYTISPLVPLGDRVVTVTTPGGHSGTDATAANTLHVVSELGIVRTPILSPHLGVVLTDGSVPPPAQTAALYAPHVGVTIGPFATGASPSVGIIGQTVTLTVTGQELASVTAVQLVPATGLTIGAPVIAPDGRSLTVSVVIDAAAPQTLRQVRVMAGTTRLTFSNPAASTFLVSPLMPEFDSISPIVLRVGAPAVSMTLNGRNFQNVLGVRVDPPTGITVSGLTINGTGTQATLNISAAAGSATGPRTVIMTVVAGESTTTPSAANTVTLGNTITGTVTPILAQSVGVVLGDPAPTPATPIGPIVAPALGLVLETTPPAPSTAALHMPGFGVVLGPYATSLQAPFLTPNSSGNLVIGGVALGDVTAVSILPAAGVTVGAITVAPDGTQVIAPIVLSGAAAGPRRVNLLRGAVLVPFVPPAGSNFQIGVGQPVFSSLSPLFANRGQTFTLTVQGSNFQGATAVMATPSAGITFDNTPSVNAAGTTLTVRLTIDANASTGARAIQIVTPGGMNDIVTVDPAYFTFTVLP